MPVTQTLRNWLRTSPAKSRKANHRNNLGLTALEDRNTPGSMLETVAFLEVLNWTGFSSTEPQDPYAPTERSTAAPGSSPFLTGDLADPEMELPPSLDESETYSDFMSNLPAFLTGDSETMDFLQGGWFTDLPFSNQELADIRDMASTPPPPLDAPPGTPAANFPPDEPPSAPGEPSFELPANPYEADNDPEGLFPEGSGSQPAAPPDAPEVEPGTFGTGAAAALAAWSADRLLSPADRMPSVAPTNDPVVPVEENGGYTRHLRTTGSNATHDFQMDVTIEVESLSLGWDAASGNAASLNPSESATITHNSFLRHSPSGAKPIELVGSTGMPGLPVVTVEGAPSLLGFPTDTADLPGYDPEAIGVDEEEWTTITWTESYSFEYTYTPLLDGDYYSITVFESMEESWTITRDDQTFAGANGLEGAATYTTILDRTYTFGYETLDGANHDDSRTTTEKDYDRVIRTSIYEDGFVVSGAVDQLTKRSRRVDSNYSSVITGTQGADEAGFRQVSFDGWSKTEDESSNVYGFTVDALGFVAVQNLTAYSKRKVTDHVDSYSDFSDYEEDTETGGKARRLDFTQSGESIANARHDFKMVGGVVTDNLLTNSRTENAHTTTERLEIVGSADVGILAYGTNAYADTTFDYEFSDTTDDYSEGGFRDLLADTSGGWSDGTTEGEVQAWTMFLSSETIRPSPESPAATAERQSFSEIDQNFTNHVENGSAYVGETLVTGYGESNYSTDGTRGGWSFESWTAPNQPKSTGRTTFEDTFIGYNDRRSNYAFDLPTDGYQHMRMDVDGVETETSSTVGAFRDNTFAGRVNNSYERTTNYHQVQKLDTELAGGLATGTAVATSNSDGEYESAQYVNYVGSDIFGVHTGSKFLEDGGPFESHSTDTQTIVDSAVTHVKNTGDSKSDYSYAGYDSGKSIQIETGFHGTTSHSDTANGSGTLGGDWQREADIDVNGVQTPTYSREATRQTAQDKTTYDDRYVATRPDWFASTIHAGNTDDTIVQRETKTLVNHYVHKTATNKGEEINSQKEVGVNPNTGYAYDTFNKSIAKIDHYGRGEYNKVANTVVSDSNRRTMNDTLTVMHRSKQELAGGPFTVIGHTQWRMWSDVSGSSASASPGSKINEKWTQTQFENGVQTLDRDEGEPSNVWAVAAPYLQLVGGIAEVMAGAAACHLGVGVLFIGHGLDNMQSALMTIMTGQPAQTFTQQGVSGGLQAVGVGAGTADMIGGYVDMALGMATGFKPCFVAGTPVRMSAAESKAIDELRMGDVIWSRDERDPSSQVVPREVVATMVRIAEVLELTFGPHTIGTTGEHPFFVKGKGWREAKFLEAGDKVASSDGGWTELRKVQWTGRTERVYNIEVREFHTYFVGEACWGFDLWTHNHGGRLPNQIGSDGMKLTGWTQNGIRIPSLSGRKAYRVPDHLSRSLIGESKNVNYLRFSSQIRDYLHYAFMTNRRLEIVTRKTTTIDPALLRAEEAGYLLIRRLF